MGRSTDGGFFVDRRCSPYDRRKGEQMNGAIVCGVDGSPDSQRALDVAARCARQLHAKLIVANVVAVPDPVVPSYAYAPMGRPGMLRPEVADSMDAELAGAEALLERIVAQAGVEDAELRTLLGIPAERLAELADDEEADLVVVGSRGRGAFKAAFLGSVSNSLIGIARCPVLVVPRGVTEAGPAVTRS
jgi:nucleotide-binding universal stress UspA family protein